MQLTWLDNCRQNNLKRNCAPLYPQEFCIELKFKNTDEHQAHEPKETEKGRGTFNILAQDQAPSIQKPFSVCTGTTTCLNKKEIKRFL